jgi:SAM-dependent methyltransferase
MPDVPRTDDLEAIDGLRAALDAAEYTSSSLQVTLALEGPFSRDPSSVPVYLRMLPESSALSTAIKLFLLGVPVDRGEADVALAPVGAERLEAIGVLEREDDRVRPLVGILPWDNFLIVSDRLDEDLPPTRGDFVLNVIPPSVALANLLPRRELDSVLDIGVGSGVQSLLASRHARRVVGVDVNERALRYAELNLRLNRVEHVVLRLGDVFEAVQGETFDLILSNPPYVVSPESHYAFRDSGLPGDSFCEALVRRAPAFLRENGLAALLVSWVHGREEDWTAPLRRWADGSGCDVLAFHYMSQEPLSYAALWNRPLRWDAVAYGRAIDRWLEYDAELGIEAIAWGALVLRKRGNRANWFVGHSMSMDELDHAGEHIDRMIAAHDHLAADGDGLMHARLRLADDHRLDQTLMIREHTGVVQGAVLRLDGGFNFKLGLSPAAFQLLLRLDGRPLAEVIQELAATASPKAGAEFLDEAVPLVRELYGLGFLVRADA